MLSLIEKMIILFFFFFQAEDGIRDLYVTGVQTCALPISMRSQHQWLDSIKTNGCWGCHGLGNKATRTILEDLGSVESSHAAWTRRIQSGQAMSSMIATINRFGAQRGISYFADWTDRIANGELPFAKPERPQG